MCDTTSMRACVSFRFATSILAAARLPAEPMGKSEGLGVSMFNPSVQSRKIGCCAMKLWSSSWLQNGLAPSNVDENPILAQLSRLDVRRVLLRVLRIVVRGRAFSINMANQHGNRL